MGLRGLLHIVFVCLSLAGSASAVMLTAEVRDTTGNTHAIDVVSTVADVPLPLEIYVTSDFDMKNLELQVESLDGTGLFKLNSLTFDTAAGWGYYAYAFTSPDLLNAAPGGHSSQLIGCLSQGLYVPAGTSRYATIGAIVKAGTAPGSYRLSVTSVLAGNRSHQDIYGAAGQAYVVNVLPEPASLLLAAGAGLLVARRRSRA